MDENTRQLLKEASEALDDWLHTFASELCDEKKVQESYDRIHAGGGTLYYIASLNQRIKQALS